MAQSLGKIRPSALPASLPSGSVNLERLKRWLHLLASYSFFQATAQGLGFIAGIIIVRSLSKADYACFLIVNTVGPAMTMLSDNGVTSSLSSIGGRFWQDDEKMGSLVSTAMILRRRLIILSFVVVTPVLIWMLKKNQASPLAILFLVLFTWVGVYCQLNVSVGNVVITLRQQIGRMQFLVLMSALPRLASLAIFAVGGLLCAPTAIASGVISLAVQSLLLRNWVRRETVVDAPASNEYLTGIMANVKRQAPLTLYFCVQGQIGIWLLSIFGSSHRVAEAGALGRIGAIFTLLVSTVSALAVPRFAREQDAARMRSRYLLLILSFGSLVAIGAGLAWLFPRPLLWILGAQYAHLGNLVWLAALSSGSATLAGLLYSLNVNKGWIPPAGVVIPAEIATQAILCCAFDLSSVRSILEMAALGPIVPSVINLAVGWGKLNEARQTQVAINS